MYCIKRIWLFLFLSWGQREAFRWCCILLIIKGCHGNKKKSRGWEDQICALPLASFPFAWNALLDIFLLYFLLQPGLHSTVTPSEGPSQTSLGATFNPPYLFTYFFLTLILTWQYACLHIWFALWVVSLTRTKVLREQGRCPLGFWLQYLAHSRWEDILVEWISRMNS